MLSQGAKSIVFVLVHDKTPGVAKYSEERHADRTLLPVALEVGEDIIWRVSRGLGS
jgi:hypothetical protein